MLDLLKRNARKLSFRKGRVIFREGESSDALYVIEKGSVEISALIGPRERRVFAIFGPGAKVVYVFGADRGSTSHCYGVCAKAWPPLVTTSAPLAGPGVEKKLLGTTKRRDGSHTTAHAISC